MKRAIPSRPSKEGIAIPPGATASLGEDGRSRGTAATFTLDSVKYLHAEQELREQKYALDQHAIVATTDVQGTITYVNDKFCAISKYSREELLGQNHRILNSGHHSKEFFQQMYHAIANGRVWRGEICNRAKDGSIYWVDTTIVPFAGEDGKPRQYVAIRADITERKRAEEALKESLATSKVAIKDLADQKFALDQHAIVATTDVQGTITYVNDKFCAISKYSREELLGQNHRILNSGHHSKEFFQQMYHSIANGQVWRGEICNRAKDGWIYWVDTTIVPFAGEDGKPRQYVAIRADITERKRAEEALQESLATSKVALKDLADQKFALDQHAIVATTDVQGTITYVNDKFCAISKYSRQELVGQNHRILNSSHHSKEFFQQMYHTIANGEVWRAEICNRAKDGSIYWVDTTVVPFLDAYGKPRQYMAIRADITERKRAEEGRERLAAVVESSDDAIISKAMDGTITGWNAGAEKVFGYSSSEAVGKSMRMLMPPDRINEEFEILARIKRGESVEHFETVRVRKGGKRIDIAATISPIRDSSGAIVGISKIARDVSERKHAEEALREQAQVLDSAQVFVRDMQSRVVFWPRGAEKLYGFTSQEALGILSHDLFHTIFPEPLEAVEKKLFETGMWEGELVHRRRDGVTIVVSSAWVLHRNGEGQPIRILETNIDITDRKQAEQRLARQAEELSRQAVELARSRQALETQTLMLQSVLDSMQEGLVAADEQGKFIIWNPAATKILGLGAANLSTQEWTSHYGVYLEDMVTPFPTDQLPLVLAIHGEASTAEMFVRKPELDQGTWIEASGGPLKDKEGAVRGGVVAFRDITRRKADEREIRKLNEELEARVLQRTSQLAAANHELADQKFALDQHAIVAMTDVEGTITYANDNFCAISQYSREELIGQNHRMMKSGQHSPEFFQEMYQTIGEGKVWHGEMMNRAKDGSFFWTNTTIVPFAGAGEKARQYAAIRTDITKRKQVEERLLQRTAQVEAANQELEAFTYSVSHDLRAPLRHIGGFSRILMEDFAAHMDPEARHHLERIQDGTHRMGLLVDELLNLARVGRYALKLQVTQLNSVVEEVVTLLQPEVEGRSVEWKIADLPSLECDPILIKQVFQNLIANSLKFTRPRDIAVIEIDYRQENGETVIFVRDNGVGFNMKYTDKLFGVFQRLHRAEDFEGTGIGLATVQRIIHKHRGRVWAEAELDKGATFYFTVGAEPADVKNKTAAAVGA